MIQFGSGAFLRGFVESFIEDANGRSVFGGRVVVVESTGGVRSRALSEQDGLYTLLTRGPEGEAARIVGAISRAISAVDGWNEVLRCARDPDLELIFSNTTEVGISLDPSDAPDLDPPRSFPGKLTRFLYERAQAFDHDAEGGVVVVPCELIEDNGERLREIVRELAGRWNLGDPFMDWLDRAVPFCNTLVDRIVPGVPEPPEAERIQDQLGYRDDLLTVSETYRLFVIQVEPALRPRLSFAEREPDVALVDDVQPYRLRKVRLLNGAHTLIAPVALLAGCTTVYDATRDPVVGEYLRRVLLNDLAPMLDVPAAHDFALDVLQRFGNPSIRHELLGITLHGTMKVRTRLVPSIIGAAGRSRAMESLALGFACHVLFMRGDLQADRRAAGDPVPEDTTAARFEELWSGVDARDRDAALRMVRSVASDRTLWEADLCEVPGFCEAAARHLSMVVRNGVRHAVAAHLRE